MQYTPQLVKTVAEGSMKVDSSKRIRSQTCCSVTIESKNHLVAPVVSIDDYQVMQEDAHRRLSKALGQATEEELETARTIVSAIVILEE